MNRSSLVTAAALLCCMQASASPQVAASGEPSASATSREAGEARSYEGPLVDGLPHGRGIMQWADGTRYEGDFVAGVRQGNGTQRYAKGDTYTGGWVGGKRSGEGVMNFVNGDRYEGRFDADRPGGLGLYRWSSGASYEGELAGGMPRGHGRLVLPTGDVYEGSFAMGQVSGPGIAISAQGWRFEGEFLAGIPTEQGRFSAADGSELRQPVSQNVREALSLKMPLSAFISKPVAAIRVCTRMPKPDVPPLGYWKGEAEYRFVVTVDQGKVSNVRAVAVKHPGKQKINDILVAGFTKAFDGYYCPGNHVFVQEFKIRVE